MKLRAIHAFARRDWRRALAAAWHGARPGEYDLDAAARKAIAQDIETRAAAWAASPDGHPGARTELMDSVDRQLLHRAFLLLAPDAQKAVRRRVPELSESAHRLERYLAAGALRIAVLHAWVGIYYRDRASGDWFETYRRAANMRLDSVKRDLERLAGTPVHAAQHHRDAAIRGLNTALRLRLLQAPAGVPIGHRSLGARLRALFRGSYHACSAERDLPHD